MLKILNIAPHKTSFGTTERRTNINLGQKDLNVANCNYIIRRFESSPNDIVDFLIEQAQKKEKTEMKIWGCSDLSSYLSKMFAMRTKIDRKTQDRLFNDIELIDIDKDLMNRNSKRLIGLTKADLEDLSYEFDVNPFEEFEKADKKNFFLEGEPKKMRTASIVDLRNIGSRAVEEQKIVPYRYSPELLKNARLRVGDIRKDIKNLPVSDKNTLRIFEFANGWYFMPEKDQMELACDFAEKMQKDDVLIVGRVELSRNIDVVLQKLGFRNNRRLEEIFVKDSDMIQEVFQNLKRFLISRAKMIK